MSKIMTVGPKGQVVIPVELREELNIKPGDSVVVERQGDGLKITTRKAVAAKLRGKYANLGVSLAKELHQERRSEAEDKGW